MLRGRGSFDLRVSERASRRRIRYIQESESQTPARSTYISLARIAGLHWISFYKDCNWIGLDGVSVNTTVAANGHACGVRL